MSEPDDKAKAAMAVQREFLYAANSFIDSLQRLRVALDLLQKHNDCLDEQWKAVEPGIRQTKGLDYLILQFVEELGKHECVLKLALEEQKSRGNS